MAHSSLRFSVSSFCAKSRRRRASSGLAGRTRSGSRRALAKRYVLPLSCRRFLQARSFCNMLLPPIQIATHTSHLSTLSSLLLSFLPAHLLPQLPPPSAPHGYPSSSTPASALARRQNFDYPASNNPGAGSTARMNAAMGIVREHWDLTRGGGMPPRIPKRKAQPTSLHQMGDGGDSGLGTSRGLASRRCQMKCEKLIAPI